MSERTKTPVMHIDVNSSGHGGTLIDVADWSRANENSLKLLIEQAVQKLGFKGIVRVHVNY